MTKNSTSTSDSRTCAGAVILCGGRSRRMGLDKAQLPFDGQTFLTCVLQTVCQCASPIVIAAGQAGSNIKLEGNWPVVFDERMDCGPLEGIRVGLKFLEPLASCAFITPCDAPLLVSELVGLLVNELGDYEAVIPYDGNQVYGTTAVYRTNVHKKIEQMITRGVLKVATLMEQLHTKAIDVDRLRSVDPSLDSFTNVNHFSDYCSLLARRGLTCPPDVLAKLNKGPL